MKKYLLLACSFLLMSGQTYANQDPIKQDVMKDVLSQHAKNCKDGENKANCGIMEELSQ